MTEAHLEIEVATMKLKAVGSEAWVDAKYEAFMAQLNDMQPVACSPSTQPTHQEKADDIPGEVGPLAIFLKQKNVGASQNKRFLATAVWLKRQGQTIIQTAEVVKALSDAQQQRLGNPADILNQNVKKGFCVKTADGFYVTPEGEESLVNTA